jgi:hypothetical protein
MRPPGLFVYAANSSPRSAPRNDISHMMTSYSDRIVHVFCRSGRQQRDAMMTHYDANCERADVRVMQFAKMCCKSQTFPEWKTSAITFRMQLMHSARPPS